jgi:hypothetical protein
MKRSGFVRFLLPIILCLATLLTGCVDYEVGVKFKTPYSGEITQHIKVDDQLTSLAPSDTRKWLNSLEKRSHQLKGSVKKLDAQELLLTIPFGNGTELAQKFNQLFQTTIVPDATIPSDQVELIELNSQVDLQQNNLVFVERNSIDLAIDLRALGVLSRQNKIIIDQDSLANLEFRLNTPWIAYSVNDSDNIQPIKSPLEKGLVWQLHPGEVNHIKAVFWLPSPIGIGAGIITFLMLAGFLLKYRRLPGVA